MEKKGKIMKIIFLLLGVGFISLKGFAVSSEGDEKSDDKNGILTSDKNINSDHIEARIQWVSRLNDKTNWRVRKDAVEDWKTALRYDFYDLNSFNDFQDIFFQLELRLSDRSQKVREAIVTAFKEMGAEWDYSILWPDIVAALAKQGPNDTENIFLRKMEIASEIFKRIDLLAILERSDESTGAVLLELEDSDSDKAFDLFFEMDERDMSKEHFGESTGIVSLELEDSGLDKVFEPLFEMAERGMSNKQNTQVRWVAIQLLDIIVEKITGSLANRLFNTSKVEGQFSGLILKGLQIAVTGLADKNLKIRSTVKDLLRKTLQAKSLSDTQVSQIVPLVAKGGFSHFNYKTRKGTIKWLLEIAKFYPSLDREITSVLQKRQKKESSQRVKKAIKNALKQLSGFKKHSECQSHWRS